MKIRGVEVLKSLLKTVTIGLNIHSAAFHNERFQRHCSQKEVLGVQVMFAGTRRKIHHMRDSANVRETARFKQRTQLTHDPHAGFPRQSPGRMECWYQVVDQLGEGWTVGRRDLPIGQVHHPSRFDETAPLPNEFLFSWTHKTEDLTRIDTIKVRWRKKFCQVMKICLEERDIGYLFPLSKLFGMLNKQVTDVNADNMSVWILLRDFSRPDTRSTAEVENRAEATRQMRNWWKQGATDLRQHHVFER